MSKAIAILFVSLTLGLGWAIRGHFGHEWGAAWAGVMAGLAVVAISRRNDWAGRTPVVGALAGVGWAVGGMMSYGRVVGFCRGSYFLDVYYGLLMLAVIGGLYGLIGGGFLGLALETSERRKPDWAALITQMVAAAMLAWGLLIYQLEWLMTPPRSELWAACLGAGVALVWYCHRGGYHLAFRTAIYSALGAGFGFAFGNFSANVGHCQWDFHQLVERDGICSRNLWRAGNGIRLCSRVPGLHAVHPPRHPTASPCSSFCWRSLPRIFSRPSTARNSLKWPNELEWLTPMDLRCTISRPHAPPHSWRC